ncbi:MAG: nicotinate (nicotinamide) nucleotide adenylyltransferase, partial [bacterium]
MENIKRLGILGGSFDPPHEAHLAMARKACNAFKLDK